MGFCWYQLLAVSAPISLDITSLWILINITKNAQYYSEPQYHWYNSTLLITEYFLYYLILPNNTQYYCHFYWYYSILHAEVILEWSLSDSGYYSVLPILLSVTNITNISQYFTILPNITQYYPILPILPNITDITTTANWADCSWILPSITNITEYYQYCTILQIQYPSILHNITNPLLLKITLVVFNINIAQY